MPRSANAGRRLRPSSGGAAAGYVAQGYRWNAGMFVARADVLLAELAEHRPELHEGLVEIAAAWDTPERTVVLDTLWPTLEKVAIDYAVAEPAADAGRVAVIPADIGWDDIGDFASLAALLAPVEADGELVPTERENDFLLQLEHVGGRRVHVESADDLSRSVFGFERVALADGDVALVDLVCESDGVVPVRQGGAFCLGGLKALEQAVQSGVHDAAHAHVATGVFGQAQHVES